MIKSPISIPSAVFARPHADAMGVASWSMCLNQGHVSANPVDTTGTTGSKRLDPGLLMGALT